MDNVTKFLWRYRWAIGIAFPLALLIIYFFGFFPYRAFMGDDLFSIVNAQTGGYASSFVSALTDVVFNKYRPVSAVIFHLESILFGNDFNSYIYLNMFIEFLNACLVSYICYRLSRKQPYVALAAGIMFIVSRFSYYNILVAIGGPIEGMALLFFLLLVYSVLNAYESKKPISLAWPLLFYFLVIFTHERYVVVGGFLVAAILLSPVNFKSRWQRYAFGIVPGVILLFNYCLKLFVLHTEFFVGTEAGTIVFDYKQFIGFMAAGFANMLGFNVGPSYLSGLHIFEAGITGFAVGGIFTVFIATLILTYIYYRFRSTPKIQLSDLRNIFLFLVLFVLLLASASITFRQTYRWLYAPYIMVILGVAYMSSRISPAKWIRFLLIICILISAISVDIFYRGYLDNVYFVDSMKIADSAKHNIIDKYGSNLSHKELFLIGADGAIKSWVFNDSTFFRFYTGDPEIQMHYVDSFEDIKNYQIDIDSILVFSIDPIKREITDITQNAKAALADHSNLLTVPSFDFLSNYEYGKISSTQRVLTPTGYGVFTKHWPGALGSEKTITIISGFSYAYDKVLIKDGDFLSFTAGIPLIGGDGAMAYVDITPVNGERKRIFKADLLPATATGIKWESFLIPCSDYAGQEVTIIFGVESPSRNPAADWVAFGSPLLLSQK